ncbi:hypothetical protein CPT_Scapp_001 [Serratia phage Scapp]|uniref:Uncharacterized protein n=1 Tax=Serratia phage Scapp TaxID=2282409 RepID=A0A345L6M8_9CAUD|nr:hypothetical protein PP898_gp01 [Serratia phage Scapp]AXH50930.1 hypothetical protein CPT_Scapp_001 [Serratia phage Scapp]
MFKTVGLKKNRYGRFAQLSSAQIASIKFHSIAVAKYWQRATTSEDVTVIWSRK